MLSYCLVFPNSPKLEIYLFDPIPTGQGWNQPLYERRVTKSGRNRVKMWLKITLSYSLWNICLQNGDSGHSVKMCAICIFLSERSDGLGCYEVPNYEVLSSQHCETVRAASTIFFFATFIQFLASCNQKR